MINVFLIELGFFFSLRVDVSFSLSAKSNRAHMFLFESKISQSKKKRKKIIVLFSWKDGFIEERLTGYCFHTHLVDETQHMRQCRLSPASLTS